MLEKAVGDMSRWQERGEEKGKRRVRRESRIWERELRELRRSHLFLFSHLLAQPVHVGAEDEALLERLHVGREAGQAAERAVVDLERLLHLAGDRLVAQAVAAVGGDANALFAGHRDDGGAIVLHDGGHGGG